MKTICAVFLALTFSAAYAQVPKKTEPAVRSNDPNAAFSMQPLTDEAPTGPIDLQMKKKASEIWAGQTFHNNEKFSSVSDETIKKLDEMIEKGAYGEIETYLKNTKADVKLINWLERKSLSGNVPMMWILSDMHAVLQNIEPAVKWSYAALFGTMQEQHLCISSETRFAAGTLAESHSAVLQLNRQNPSLIKPSKQFAFTTLMAAQAYPSPEKWLCARFTSSAALQSKNRVTSYDPVYFNYLRAEARNKLRITYEVHGSAQETLPAVEKTTAPATK